MTSWVPSKHTHFECSTEALNLQELARRQLKTLGVYRQHGNVTSRAVRAWQAMGFVLQHDFFSFGRGLETCLGFLPKGSFSFCRLLGKIDRCGREGREG